MLCEEGSRRECTTGVRIPTLPFRSSGLGLVVRAWCRCASLGVAVSHSTYFINSCKSPFVVFAVVPQTLTPRPSHSAFLTGTGGLVDRGTNFHPAGHHGHRQH